MPKWRHTPARNNHNARLDFDNLSGHITFQVLLTPFHRRDRSPTRAGLLLLLQVRPSLCAYCREWTNKRPFRGE